MTVPIKPPKGYSAEFVACHQSPHWMRTIPVRPGDPHSGRPPAGCVRVWWRCERCGTERYDMLDLAMNVVERYYWWPEGYKVPRDETPDRASWRATFLELEGVLSANQARQARRLRREYWEAAQ
jgi:hypothetical protein